VFERSGYLDARVADIVAEGDVAQGTFYTYFDSKDAIFQEVANQVADEMIRALRRDGSPIPGTYDRIYAAMERFVAAYKPRARMIALVEQVGTFTPEMKRLRLNVREAFVDRAARGIRRQQLEGVAEDTLDPDMLGEVLGAMVDHVCYMWLNLDKAFEREDLLQTLSVVWTRAIGASVPEATLREIKQRQNDNADGDVGALVSTAAAVGTTVSGTADQGE
jgi:AcrR family transcriptional regulator